MASTVGKIVLQAAVLVLIGGAVGVAVNQMRDKSLKLQKNYFATPSHVAVANAGHGDAGSDASKSAGRPDKVQSADAAADDQPEAGSDAATGHADQAGGGYADGYAPAPEEDGMLIALGVRSISKGEVIEVFNSPDYVPGTSATRYAFVDAREEDIFAEGHIPGAYQVSHYFKEDDLPEVLPFIEYAEKIIVYCNGGQCEDSALVAGDLLEEGIPPGSIFVFKGGWEAWVDCGQPVEKD